MAASQLLGLPLVDAQRRLAELAKLPPAARPVVSVYLDTR
jgi:hypothetical protein